MLNEYKPAFNQGLRMGIVSIVLFVILGVNFLALPILFMILGSRDCKANFSPYKFGNAFNAAFFTAIVSVVIVLVFNIVFVTLIDPSWEQELGDEVVTTTEEFMENLGAPQEQIDETIAQVKIDMENTPKGALGQAINAGKSLFWYVILALIIGAIQKDKNTDENLIA